MTTYPPAQPSYVFRGHGAQIHAVHFLRHNKRLLTGDADGWVVLWNLANKRAVAVWRPHTAAILGVGGWGDERIITHGRDSHFRVWQLRTSEESGFSTILPVEETVTYRKEPWLLHSLPVNTLNFCSFASCPEQISTIVKTPPSTIAAEHLNAELKPSNEPPALLVATLAPRDDTVAIWSLPSEARRYTVQPPSSIAQDRVGMVMAIRLLYTSAECLCCITGHESGLVAVQRLCDGGEWSAIYVSRPHSQPVLSIDVVPRFDSGDTGFTLLSSSADAIIALHRVPAGDVDDVLAESPPDLQANTRHAGQQGLTVRSDGRILATAGWDGRVRVYSTKNLQELAVLKWHSLGCYALAFSEVVDRERDEGDVRENEGKEVERRAGEAGAVPTVRQRREQRVQTTHWIAVGSKDGKISLWDIY